MDDLDWLGIRFYYNSQFEHSKKCLSYVGGHIHVTFIQRDSVSLATVREQLADIKMAYYSEDLSDNHRLYWLFPGKNVRYGLRRLNTDANVQFMDKCITDGGMMDIYVNYEDNGAVDGQGSGFDSGEGKKENNVVNKEEKSEDNSSDEHDLEHSSDEDEDAAQHVPSAHVAYDESSDECEDLDWCLGDEESSGEDEKAQQLRKHAKKVL